MDRRTRSKPHQIMKDVVLEPAAGSRVRRAADVREIDHRRIDHYCARPFQIVQSRLEYLDDFGIRCIALISLTQHTEASALEPIADERRSIIGDLRGMSRGTQSGLHVVGSERDRIVRILTDDD